MIDYDYTIAKLDELSKKICGESDNATDLEMYRHLINAVKYIYSARTELFMVKIAAGECDCEIR